MQDELDDARRTGYPGAAIVQARIVPMMRHGLEYGLVLCQWLLFCLVAFVFLINAGPAKPRRSCGRRRAAPVARPIRSNRKSPEIIRRIIRLAALSPEDGCRKIADTFNRLHAARYGVTVGKTFVAEVLRDHAYAIEDERRHIRRRQATVGPRNVTWAIDLTGKGDEAGTCHAILGLIDHGTRRLLTLQGLLRFCSWTLLGHLCFAIARYGKPKIFRTDNASVFTSRVFRAGLMLLGIRHQRSERGKPWQNGRIERFFGTLKSRLDRWVVANGQELADALAVFATWYNEIRPHENLAGCTPLEAWNGIDPYAKPPRRVSWFTAWDGLLTGFIMRR